MVYYLSLILILILFRLISLIIPKTAEKGFFFLLSCLIIVLFQGLRSVQVGTDIPTYLKYFEHIALGYDTAYELGYEWLVRIVYALDLDFQALLFIITVIIQVPIIYTICKYTNKPLLGIVVYFAFGEFLFTFSGLRQGIAMSLAFFGYGFIKNHKPIKFMILVLAGSLFHVTSIFNLVIYPLFYLRNTKKEFLFSVLLIAIVFIFNEHLVVFATELFGRYKVVVKTGAYEMFFAYLVLWVVTLWIRPRQFDQEYMGLRNMLLVVVLIYAMAPVSNVITRLAYPFELFLCLFIPWVTECIRGKPRFFYDMLCYGLCLAFFISHIGWLDTLPYSLIFIN